MQHINEKGEVVEMEQMHTMHLFNLLKMNYNHLAFRLGGKTQGYSKPRAYLLSCDPGILVDEIYESIRLIEERGDLDPIHKVNGELTHQHYKMILWHLRNSKPFRKHIDKRFIPTRKSIKAFNYEQGNQREVVKGTG